VQLHQLTEAPPLLLLPAVMGSHSHAGQVCGSAAVSAAECACFWADVLPAADELTNPVQQAP
jgi:hypothetical protein